MQAIEPYKNTNREKILIVDDSPQILCVISEVLTVNGYEVITADTGKNALDHLTKRTPDIIICDVIMPEMDGYQVYSEIQNNPDWSTIPFLFLTALSSQTDIRIAKEMGCDDYIVKPFDPEELLASVRGRLTNLQRRKVSLESNMKTYRKRVIQTLSHEFRTPLVAISTGTELLIEQFERMTPANIKKLLNAIRRGGLRLEELVENFIILQQVESGKAEESFRRFHNHTDLGSITRRALEDIASVHSTSVIRLTIDPNENGLNVDLFEAHYRAAFKRILDNAIKFGGKNNPVDVTVGSNHDFVWTKVRDYGPGLPEGTDELVQQMFIQINREKNEQQGCGLGLSIASAYAHINKGEIIFCKPLDGGSGLEVSLRFPRVALIGRA